MGRLLRRSGGTSLRLSPPAVIDRRYNTAMRHPPNAERHYSNIAATRRNTVASWGRK